MIFRLSDGKVLKLTEATFVDYVAADRETYFWQLSLNAGQSWLFRREMLPSWFPSDAGEVFIAIYVRIGAIPAVTDPMVTSYQGYWNGEDLLEGTIDIHLRDYATGQPEAIATFEDLEGLLSDLQIQVATLQRAVRSVA